MKQLYVVSASAIVFVVFFSGCSTKTLPQDKSAWKASAQTVNYAPKAAPATPRVIAKTPEEKMREKAAKCDAEIAHAKSAASRDPKNWRVFNELGLTYYRQFRYDQAIASFKQALALHSITMILESEKQEANAKAAHRAALKAKRDADVRRAEAASSNQEMGQLLGLISSVAGVSGNVNAQLLVNTMDVVNNNVSSVPINVPALSPEIKAASSLKAKCEVANIYVCLGSAYFGKKDYEQAIISFENVIQLDPSRTEVLKPSADAQYWLCRYSECITTFAIYHAIAPIEPSSLLRLSDAYRALGMATESDKAFAAFLVKQDRFPTDAVKLMKIGATCLSHWRYEEALKYLTKSRQVVCDYPNQERRFDEAELKQFHTTNAISLLLAEAHFNLLQTKEAVALLREATMQDPSYPKAWYMLARCYDQIGDSGKSMDAYGKALAAFKMTKSKNSSADYIQVCRAANGDGDDAVKVMETHLATVPLTPGGGVNEWCTLAFTYEKAGRIPESIEILNRCFDTMPAYTKVKLTLNRLDKQMESERQRLLLESDTALNAGNKSQSLAKLADAYRLTATGKKKEDIRERLLKMAASMDTFPPMTNKSQDHYLRGSVALKAATTPKELGQSLSEFQWSVFYAPWVGELYFNTSAVKKLQNQTVAAAGDLKLYLIPNAGAKNVDKILNRLYDFDYQHKKKLRELAAIPAF